jgi:glycerol-3-phosphate dehydrogenase subunit C
VTTTYDPRDPAYHDLGDLRGELGRVFDLCHGCRLCLSLCPSFPTMFDAIDARDGAVDEMTPAEQDRVVDECYQCKLCYVKCPYVPPHEWQLDFPRLMLRAVSARREHEGGLAGLRERVTTEVLGRTDLLGRVASVAAPLANLALRTPGSGLRKAMDKLVGVSSQRVLPPFAKVRFSTWFEARAAAGGTRPGRPEQGKAAIFPTCLVEYQDPGIGHDLVKVYERNGVSCSLVDRAACCGAPFLHAGDFDGFLRQARRNLPGLIVAVRSGKDIVVPQPTCGYVLKRDYPEYLDTDEARLVGEHTYDASEYLWRLHRGESTEIDTDFPGEVPESTAYHLPCHLQAQNIGMRSRDLLKLTGTKVTVVNKCSGIDGMWGLRSSNYELAKKVAGPLRDAIGRADADVVAGDCRLANGAITEETGRRVRHPLQQLARAYGIPEEPGASR